MMKLTLTLVSTIVILCLLGKVIVFLSSLNLVNIVVEWLMFKVFLVVCILIHILHLCVVYCIAYIPIMVMTMIKKLFGRDLLLYCRIPVEVMHTMVNSQQRCQ